LPQNEDDGFHEIQLNGKQLVFLFMAATVVSVVIFLCGVLVGRGVRAERGTAVAEASVADASETTPAPTAAAAASTSVPPPAGSDPRAASPPPAADELSYFDRLEKNGPAKEDLKASTPKATPAPPKETPAPKEAAAPKAAATPPPAPAAREAAPKSATDSGEFAVQVAALNARGEADAIARRLTSKGYAAYVVPPGSGAVMFRVRVGHFKTRHDAEPVFAKLQKEEQFKPWITR
jgi:cell division septation protein DedD